MPRCPRAFCAHPCALGDECAERVCYARSIRYAQLRCACPNRDTPSCQAFCSCKYLSDSLANRTSHRASRQLCGWHTRTANSNAAKLVRFPHVSHGAVEPAWHGPANTYTMSVLGPRVLYRSLAAKMFLHFSKERFYMIFTYFTFLFTCKMAHFLHFTVKNIFKNEM